MLTLKEIRQWVADLGIVDDGHVYIGKLDNKKECSIGVYRRKGSGPPVTALGGSACSSYDVRRISLLVHWNRSVCETEEAAVRFFERLRQEAEDPAIRMGDTEVRCLSLQVPEPVDVGTDDNGVYEYVIWMDLYFERKRG